MATKKKAIIARATFRAAVQQYPEIAHSAAQSRSV
jgi:hypothetical protein